MNELLALAKANNDVYMAGYRTGFEAGYKEALDKAVAILEKVPKPSAVRTLVAGEPA
jgi:flagellar biosynthesis/type III secretory pathway protein FliH